MGRLNQGLSAIDPDGNYKILALTNRHRAIARQVASGVPPGQVSTEFGITPSQVSILLGTPLFQAEVARIEKSIEERLQEEVTEQLVDLQIRAVQVLEEELYRPDVSEFGRKMRQSTALAILDRAGHGPTRINRNIDDVPAKDDVMKALVSRARSAKLQVANITLDIDNQDINSEKVSHGGTE